MCLYACKYIFIRKKRQAEKIEPFCLCVCVCVRCCLYEAFLVGEGGEKNKFGQAKFSNFSGFQLMRQCRICDKYYINLISFIVVIITLFNSGGRRGTIMIRNKTNLSNIHRWVSLRVNCRKGERRKCSFFGGALFINSSISYIGPSERGKQRVERDCRRRAKKGSKIRGAAASPDATQSISEQKSEGLRISRLRQEAKLSGPPIGGGREGASAGSGSFSLSLRASQTDKTRQGGGREKNSD